MSAAGGEGAGGGGSADTVAPGEAAASSGAPGAGGVGRARQIAVIGAGGAQPGSEIWNLAEAVGRGLGEAGVVLVSGGRGGVMEASCRGAAAAGGETIGILPGYDLGEANRYCTRVIATGVGHARNLAVVGSGEVVIAVGGEWGTLSEIGLARAIGRAVVALRSWGLDGRERMQGAPGIEAVETADEAVAVALAALPA